MRRLSSVIAAGVLTLPSLGAARQTPTANAGPNKVLKTARVGGDGGFDYVNADAAGRRLYIARTGTTPRITVFNLDTLEHVGDIPMVSAHGEAVDPKVNHGFATSKPLAMFDSKTLTMIKTIDVGGNPDGIFFDPFNERVYDLSHGAPNATVIDAKDGSIIGTIDVGGAPEQGVSDENGHVYIDLEDKGNVAVVDAKTLAVTTHYDLQGKGGACAGLAIDAKNHILFVACRDPQTMVIISAVDGKIIASLPIGTGTDGAVFNPKTMEAFSSNRDGTLTIIKENSPTSFEMEQKLQTAPNAKTLTLDSKTGHIFLIAADFTTPHATPPGGRAGRGQVIPETFSILEVGR